MPSLKIVLARVLAVLALAVVAIALFLVISSSLESDSDDEPAQKEPRAEQPDPNPPSDDRPDEPRRFYVLAPGESLSVVEEKTGVSIERIQQLNPEITDFQLIPAGTRLRVR